MKKLCVIGGAGARSAFLTKSLAKSARDIRVDRIVLLDNDPLHLRTYGEISRRLAALLDPELDLRVTDDPREALAGADYIITSIRAGGDAGRLFDEETCLARGVLGQETTGAGGFAMAIRSVPTLLDYCALAREVSNPGHLIFNFTNPSGIITQALRMKGFDNVYGICDAPSGFIRNLESLLDAEPGELEIECYGLNHLSWFRNARFRGRDVQEELARNPRTYAASEMRFFTPEMVRLSGGELLNEYLYFYYRRVRSLSMIQAAERPRGRMIAEINGELEQQLSRLKLPEQFREGFDLYMAAYGRRENAYFSVESGTRREKAWGPPTVEEFLAAPDEGGYAAVALRFIRAVTEGVPCRMVLSVPNNGAIQGLRDDDVVEISCDIRKDGAHPVSIGEIDEFQLQQLRRLKYFERCTIQAILENDRDAAVKGLFLHPLVNDLELAAELAAVFFDKYAEFIPKGRAAPG